MMRFPDVEHDEPHMAPGEAGEIERTLNRRHDQGGLGQAVMRAAPRLWVVYLAAGVIALLAAITAAFLLGAFRHEPHPDPTRGSLAALLAIPVGIGAFVLAGSVLVGLRWLLWPQARSLALGLQAAAFLAVLGSFALQYFFVPLLVGLFTADRRLWTEIEPTPVPEGQLAPYFPAAYQRFERFDASVQHARFVEFGVEGRDVYRREGFVGMDGAVARCEYASEREAGVALQKLIRDAAGEGYRPTAGGPSQ